MFLSHSRNSYSVAVGRSEGLYCALGCSRQAALKASGSPMCMSRGTLGPPRALLLSYWGSTWNDQEGSVNPSCSMRSRSLQACLGWGRVLLQSSGLGHLFIQPGAKWLPEGPAESSVPCSSGHQAAGTTGLRACLNIPVTLARTRDVCKPKSSFATAIHHTVGVWASTRSGAGIMVLFFRAGIFTWWAVGFPTLPLLIQKYRLNSSQQLTILMGLLAAHGKDDRIWPCCSGSGWIKLGMVQCNNFS